MALLQLSMPEFVDFTKKILPFMRSTWRVVKGGDSGLGKGQGEGTGVGK